MRINPGEPKQVEKPSIKKIIYELLLTLNSRARPYTEIKDLERDFQVDTGYNPALLAYEMGFPTFEAFIKCDEMSKYVSIRLDDGGQTTLYLPHPDPKIKHIRSNLLASDNYVESRKEKDENEKMARAMQPEFRGWSWSCLCHLQDWKGKRRLVDLAYKLGAEIKDISYQEVQTAYLAKYKVVLAKDELRKFFARDSPSKILIEMCCEEFVVSRSDLMHGMMFLRLRRPYREIVQMHTEKLALQEQYEKSKKNVQKERKFAPFPYDRSVRRKGLTNGMDLVLRPVLPKIAMEYTDEMNVETIFGDSSEQQHEVPSKFSLPRSLVEKRVRFVSPSKSQRQNSSSRQPHVKTDKLFPSSLFNNKDGGCTSSNVCKSFEEEYGGKANRKVQNSLRHLQQVHNYSSSSSEEREEQSEGKSVVEQINSSLRQPPISSSDVQQEEVKLKPSSVLLSEGSSDEVVAPPRSKFSIPAPTNVKQQQQVKVEKSLPAKNGSLPPMGVQTRWKPDESSDSGNEQHLNGLTRNSAVGQTTIHRRIKGTDRAEALRDFIHAVVYLHSPDFVDLKFLQETLDLLDPHYEIVLESLSLRQFIKQNCDNAVMGMYRDSEIVGWRN